MNSPKGKSILKNDEEASPVDYERFERELPMRVRPFNDRKHAKCRLFITSDTMKVTIRLPVEVLLELKHGVCKPKPPRVKVQLSAEREKQISEYKTLLLKEERQRRYELRYELLEAESHSESREDNPFLETSVSPLKSKKVSFQV